MAVSCSFLSNAPHIIKIKENKYFWKFRKFETLLKSYSTLQSETCRKGEKRRKNQTNKEIKHTLFIMKGLRDFKLSTSVFKQN